MGSPVRSPKTHPVTTRAAAAALAPALAAAVDDVRAEQMKRRTKNAKAFHDKMRKLFPPLTGTWLNTRASDNRTKYK
ncbi:hypothetical protein ABLO19_17735, partial [Mycobacterium tuberculosis]